MRAIEYEIVPKASAQFLGVTPDVVDRHLGSLAQVAIVRCVDDRGTKLTALGDAEHFRRQLASGEAQDPSGMALGPGFPLVIRGWRQHRR